MRRKIIAGNWKLNGTIPETKELISHILSAGLVRDGVEVVVCPPYISLSTAGKLLHNSGIALGAQDMSEHDNGAYTGEVSATMLLTVGVTCVILGHSERRQYHGETDRMVNIKAKLALDSGLTPIICVGETLAQRENGQTQEVIGAQVDGTVKELAAEQLGRSVVAYEPVWAIGTGKTATPEMAQEVHAFIRGRLSAIDGDAASAVPILYGGSVKPSNASSLLSQPDIDGALVGGASLKAEDFAAIISAA
ncbi:MAG: triose-phosphate isomerase [Candidatus Zixiibacteriota bacterium]